MPKVSIIMGSDSDMKVMVDAADMLDEFGIEYEMRIISAHRDPDALSDYVKGLEKRGVRVMIAGAGKAAALPGVCASMFSLPVIGVPIKTSDLGGVDSLYSIVQMPSGVPVATVAINGAKNAGILAAEILATGDDDLASKLKAFRKEQAYAVKKKDEKLLSEGKGAFL